MERQLVTPTTGPAELTTRLKSHAAERTVPLGARALHEFVAMVPSAIEIPDPADDTRKLIFTNRDRRPVRRQTAGNAWPNARDRLGLPEDARWWHTLRHFYASALIRAGLSVVDVQARLGHASADETLGTYARLWPDSGDRTRQPDDVFGLSNSIGRGRAFRRRVAVSASFPSPSN